MSNRSVNHIMCTLTSARVRKRLGQIEQQCTNLLCTSLDLCQRTTV